MYNKLRIAVLFGGQSAEHDISLMSAKNVINALDPKKYDIIPIGIDRHGKMYIQQLSMFKLNQPINLVCHLNKQVAILPGNGHGITVSITNREDVHIIDVAFPVLHGTYGEDGVIQGLLRAANIPFVGSDVLGSSLCMDKDVTKRLLRDGGIKVADFITLRKHQFNQIDEAEIIKTVGLPCFVKPANMGSSIGVNKVKQKAELMPAIKQAFEFDNKVIVEKFIKGREIECAVLGNETLAATHPGEIIPQHEFYSYDAKYFDEKGATVVPHAELDSKVAEKIKDISMKAFHMLECKGMARVDFFVTAENEIYLNEVNTIPGFTQISQYPKMWQASGMGYAELLDKLIELAQASYDSLHTLKLEP